MARFDQLGREPVRFKPVVRLKGHPANYGQLLLQPEA
jgi:hypothetical protein